MPITPGQRITKLMVDIGGDNFACNMRNGQIRRQEQLTFCPVEIYDVVGELELSYGANGSWNKLKAIEGTTVTVTAGIDADNSTAAVDNPIASGPVRIKPIDFIPQVEPDGKFLMAIEWIGNDAWTVDDGS